jgi:hypothetical protein
MLHNKGNVHEYPLLGCGCGRCSDEVRQTLRLQHFPTVSFAGHCVL